MKKLQKYLLHLALFCGIMVAVRAWISLPVTLIAESYCKTTRSYLTEKDANLTFSVPDECIPPISQFTGSIVNGSRLQHNTQMSFIPVNSYAHRSPACDYSKEDEQRETMPEASLLVVSRPSLRYVFLLRQILI